MGQDHRTVEVYDRRAQDWVADHHPRDLDHVAWVAASRMESTINHLPILDIGCGPGWHLTEVPPPVVALDASQTMLDLVPGHAPHAQRVKASADGLPIRTGSLRGAVASRVYLHLPATTLPLALADLHRALGEGGRAFVKVMGDESGIEYRAKGNLPDRLFSGWQPDRLKDVCVGAGFKIDGFEVKIGAKDKPSGFDLRLTRSWTLPDTVGPSMRLLICGLNPSPLSADLGVGFARPGNRFWPAALAAGIVGADRDSRRALLVDGIGMTDLAKRPTRTAVDLSVDEYTAGLARVERLTEWLKPGVVCFVGLAGWRAAVNRKAVAGLQPGPFGGAPAYVMPSTSGLNAHASAADLRRHLRAAADLILN